MVNFDAFYKKKFGDLAAYGRNCGLSSADSDDIAQNVMIDFWKRLENNEIDESKGNDPFIFQRMRWRIMDANIKNNLETKRFQSVGEENDLDELELKNDKEIAAFKWNAFKRAAKLLKNQINPKAYEFFVERTFGGKTTAEIAEKYNVNANQVYLTKHRVLQKVVSLAKEIIKNEL